jgi:hypothetical protein
VFHLLTLLVFNLIFIPAKNVITKEPKIIISLDMTRIMIKTGKRFAVPINI